MCVDDAAYGGAAGSAAVDCDPAKILSRQVAPNCPVYHAPRVVNGCYGDDCNESELARRAFSP
jgi:hypothetical protein